MGAKWAALLLSVTFLAGCSDTGSQTDDTPSTADDIQDEFNVKPTDTKGVLLGVVVDEAIRPVEAVKVAINLADGTLQTKTSDTQGRFAFGDLEPGVYLLEFSHTQYATLATSVEVRAGEEDPPVHRFQVTRLFAQEPYTEMISFDGYLACAFAVGTSSTCVNDYTRIVGERCTPVGGVCTTQCAGGCFRDLELAKQGGNRREYVSTIGPGWQSVIFETTWDPTTETGENLGFTVSFYARPDAVHRYGGTSGPDPLRLQLDTGVEHDSAQQGAADHTIIPANGTEELFVFYSAGGAVVVNQQFTAYQTTYYYAIPEEGWSFIGNGPPPY